MIQHKSEKWVHDYFDRRSSEWTITSFLDECEAQSFPDKIGQYLTSLEAIAKNENCKRGEKALQLYKRYKQASVKMFLVIIDKKLWRGRHPKDLCHSSLYVEPQS